MFNSDYYWFHQLVEMFKSFLINQFSKFKAIKLILGLDKAFKGTVVNRALTLCRDGHVLGNEYSI